MSVSAVAHNLSNPTSFFGVKFWVATLICIVSCALIFTIIYICWRCKKEGQNPSKHVASKDLNDDNLYTNCSMDQRLLSRDEWDIEMRPIGTPQEHVMHSGDGMINGDDGRNVALREIETTAGGLSHENVIGSGQYGVVFHGFLINNTQVAVKKLFSNRSRKQTFSREAEAMLLIRHKNLVKLLGYCAEGACRMLVYEYVDNGNLKQWLHQCTSKVSPLTWSIRMQIITGIAKGLAYLHEDTEPPLIHRNIKSSNILLDQQWNPKISDVGITKFLGNHAAASPAMSGYTEHDYCSHARDEKSDVYSFGILIMEIVSGKTTTVSSGNEIEGFLVDWIKSMVAEKKFDLILDPNMAEEPTIKQLKRILLIALRCVDFDVEKRPRMGEIIHMVEARDLLLNDLRIKNACLIHHLRESILVYHQELLATSAGEFGCEKEDFSTSLLECIAAKMKTSGLIWLIPEPKLAH